MRNITLWAALLLAPAACAHLPGSIEKPTASVEGVAVGDVSFRGLRGELDLSIFNPNGFGVPLENVDWELSVGGARAVSGSFSLSQTIPAKASAPVVAGLSISPLDAAQVGAALAQGADTYTVRGSLRFATTFGRIEVPFEHNGSIARL